ncbi:UNVERIFIED_CONTAM: Tetratricopeptide repeat protein SKI3 [Sesamum latifolium]|uniref:Tetratricopeptide repeat protein SKI3 n=1 Tax=Sesamum latifolium TaxID=2727402 RepID=A0AAW2XN38_9LAMI
MAHQKKWSEAIQSLQHAIHGFPMSPDLWETLGLAYQRMGMFTAALKSYGRAVELDNSRVFALIESGNTCLMLGSFRKGIEHFQQTLEISPHNVSALYGLASALLGLAKECANLGAFRWGASLLELMYARCYPWEEEARPRHSDEISFKSSINTWKRTCHIAARNASRSYQRALHLALASDLCSSFKESPKTDLNVWSVAEKLCLGGLLLEGYNDEFWVALGCLSDHTALKQHALIRGLQLDVSLAVAWAYLGKLYRREGQKQLAQQAFDRARSIDPSLALPWAGMAADAGARKLDQNEAYECCLRATQIFPAVRWSFKKQDSFENIIVGTYCLEVLLLAEFQVGLAKLALHSSYLSSSELKHGSKNSLGIQKGVDHLRKALHMYPNSSLLRNLLSYLLLSSKEWRDLYLATRCSFLDLSDKQKYKGIKSAFEILGAGTVACYAIGSPKEKFPFPTCRHQHPSGSRAIQLLQKFLHQEPWNFNARYLLTLNCLQKARQERFAPQICRVLERLTAVALHNQFYSSTDVSCQYQSFQLLLCAAELSLFAHLLLCRAYATEDDIISISKEYRQCLALGTDLHFGWICLKFIESRYQLGDDSTILPLCFEDCCKDIKLSWNMWMALFNMVQGLIAIWCGDFVAAEESFTQASSLADGESCIFLCHGAICMELARQKCESQYISRAIRSLMKAKNASPDPLPIISLLLAQAEASLGSKAKWEVNLQNEWFSWPPEMRPAELLFQMHLLSRQRKDGSMSSSSLDYADSSLSWILRAIHTNPSCSRYWKFLLKDM